jgi:hypothetical protein
LIAATNHLNESVRANSRRYVQISKIFDGR